MDIHKIIGKIPFKPKKGFVLPSHKYTGPYNPLDEQLDQNDIPIRGQEPFNRVDAISMRHDICYRDNNSKNGKMKCDDKMLIELDRLHPGNFREKLDRRLVRSIIAGKKKLGWGVVRWSSELADELHKPIRRKFTKRRVVVKKANDIWAADIVEMQPFSRYNNGYKYLLMVIDVFSKYGWTIPLKTKTGTETAKAINNLMKTQSPQKLWTDKGKEFYNKHVSRVLEKYNVELYSTENEEKSCVVERWNRTIKRNMWKYFSANNTNKYIDILPNLIEKYNKTYHRSIKLSPEEAIKPENHQHVFNALYPSERSHTIRLAKFKVGDRVRIVKKKKTFDKGYTPNWTEEVFTVSEVKNTNPPTYSIKDWKDEQIKGSFYEEELQKTTQTKYRIEKVLKKRNRNGVKEVLVKWSGYNKEFNSWIPLNNLQSVNNT